MTKEEFDKVVEALANDFINRMGVHRIISGGKSKPFAAKCQKGDLASMVARHDFATALNGNVACLDCVSCSFTLEKIAHYLRMHDTVFRASEHTLSQMAYPKQPFVGECATRAARHIVTLWQELQAPPVSPSPAKKPKQAPPNVTFNFEVNSQAFVSSIDDMVERLAQSMRDNLTGFPSSPSATSSAWGRTRSGGKTTAVRAAIRDAVLRAGGSEADADAALNTLAQMADVQKVGKLRVPVDDLSGFKNRWPGTVSFDIEQGPDGSVIATVRDSSSTGYYEAIDVSTHSAPAPKTILGIPYVVDTLGALGQQAAAAGIVLGNFNDLVKSAVLEGIGQTEEKAAEPVLGPVTEDRDTFLTRVLAQYNQAGGIVSIRGAAGFIPPAPCQRNMVYQSSCGVCRDCLNTMVAFHQAGERAVKVELDKMDEAEANMVVISEELYFVTGATIFWQETHKAGGPAKKDVGTELPTIKLW